MPWRMSPGEHFREAERLVYESSKSSGLPADVAPDKPAPDASLLVAQALVHAVLAHAHEPHDRRLWWRRRKGQQ